MHVTCCHIIISLLLLYYHLLSVHIQIMMTCLVSKEILSRTETQFPIALTNFKDSLGSAFVLTLDGWQTSLVCLAVLYIIEVAIIQASTQTNRHTHTHAHTHTKAHTRMHTHTHTNTHTLMVSPLVIHEQMCDQTVPLSSSKNNKHTHTKKSKLYEGRVAYCVATMLEPVLCSDTVLKMKSLSGWPAAFKSLYTKKANTNESTTEGKQLVALQLHVGIGGGPS